MKAFYSLATAVVVTIIFAPFCLASDMTPSTLEGDKFIMINRDLIGRDINDYDVIAAMNSVPREEFVPKKLREKAYFDGPLYIGEGQTISQPYIVALMTQALKPKKSENVLEVGTGSGYQAAVISLLVKHVYTVEIIDSLAKSATARLERLKYDNVTVTSGDGYKGWPDKAPFDKIIVTAAAAKVPKPLEKQLAEGGLLIMPVGGASSQVLILGEKKEGVVKYKLVTHVRFVPMTGEAQKQQKENDN